MSILFFDFSLQFFHMMIDFRVIILDGLVEADDRLAHLFLEIIEKSLDNCHHLGFSFNYSFFEFFLFFPFILLIFLHVTGVTIEFFNHLLEKGTQVVDNFVHAGLIKAYFSY